MLSYKHEKVIFEGKKNLKYLDLANTALRNIKCSSPRVLVCLKPNIQDNIKYINKSFSGDEKISTCEWNFMLNELYLLNFIFFNLNITGLCFSFCLFVCGWVGRQHMQYMWLVHWATMV